MMQQLVEYVRGYVSRFYSRWSGNGKVPEIESPIAATPEPETVPVPAQPKETIVSSNFRASILDRLDECFPCMERLRRHDEEAYQTFRRIGFSVSKYYAAPEIPLAKFQGIKQPAFGGILCSHPTHEKESSIYPSFIYFSKLNCPKTHVELTKLCVYRVTVLYMDREKQSEEWTFGKDNGVCEFYLAVAEDWSVKLLKQMVFEENTIYRKRSNNGKKQEPIYFPSKSWKTPEWLAEIASDKNTTPEEWAAWMFRLAAYTYVESGKSLLVRAEKRAGLAATFGIDLKRAPYFFKDRDDTILTENGTRKKIFHSVIEHKRRLQDGRETMVKGHYRGLRDFAWNDYSIHIVLPENAEKFRTFDVAGYESGEERNEKTLPQSRVAEILKQVVGS